MAETPKVNFETKTLPLVEELFGYKLEQLNGAKFTFAQLTQLANKIFSGNKKLWGELNQESERIITKKYFTTTMNALVKNLTPDKLEQFWKARLQLALTLSPNSVEEIQDFLNNHSWENDKFELSQLGTKVKAFIEKNRNDADRAIISEILKSEDANELLNRPHLNETKKDKTIIETRYLASCLAQLNQTIFEIENFDKIRSKNVTTFINATKCPVLNHIIGCAISNSCANKVVLSKKEFNALKQEWMGLAKELKPLIQSADRKPIKCNIEESCITCTF
jgi:hypothetical protein